MLRACSQAATGEAAGGVVRTRLHVMGTIHANHRRSTAYSLDVLEAAIRKAAPDIILAEIPPDRIRRALSTFRETGQVDEPRTEVFPEYTDVVFPLSRETGFRILGTSGWTQAIADDRRAALRRIENDPERASQWAEHRAAQRQFARAVAGRGDDPRFIHTERYDRLVEASREPYRRHFDADLGAGGWTRINRAHTGLINAALDAASGRGLTALVTFGAAHKPTILASIAARADIELLDTRALFN
jgi:hypothetical protein